MRKIIYLVILSFFSFETVASLFEDRGFKEDKCYRHLVYLSKDRSQCLLHLFPDSQAQLSFSILGCPETLLAGQWQMAIFKVAIVNRELQFTFLKSYAVETDIAKLLVKNEQGLAQTVKCP
jgi:hypothetical protein